MLGQSHFVVEKLATDRAGGVGMRRLDVLPKDICPRKFFVAHVAWMGHAGPRAWTATHPTVLIGTAWKIENLHLISVTKGQVVPTK